MTDSLALIIIFIATLGQVLFGFGGGLIAIPLLSLIVGVHNAVTLALVLQLVSGILVWRIRADLRWAVLWPTLGGLVIGTTTGLFFLSLANESFLRLFLAAFIILFLIKSQFFGELSFPILNRPGGGGVVGLVAGLLQGLIGSGGPPLVIYLSETIKDKAAMRAGLLFLLFVTNCLRLPLSVSTDLFNSDVIRLSIAAIPCFVVAIFLGHRTHHLLSERQYHLALRVILIVSTALLIFKSLPHL